MENPRRATGIEESGNGDHYRQRRSRQKVPKFSTVSARLDPDFDARELAHQNSSLPIQNNEELDPHTISFEELVKLLHPNFVTDYLQKVLHYLKSDNTEICFPNIAPYKEAFLMKIAEERSNLKCINVNEIARVVARQILDILDAKKDTYTWTFKYESGRVSKNVLVYRKVYRRDSQNKSTSNSKALSTPNPSLPTLSIEDLPKSNKRKELPMSFKTETLNTTLKFMKDNNRFSLHYPPMPVSHAEFVYSLLHSTNREEENVGFGFRSLYAPLVEAMKSCEAECVFKVSFVDTYSDELIQVVLQKIPKVHKNADSSNRKRSRSNTDLNTSTESTGTTGRPSKSTVDLECKRRAVDGVTESFRLDTLRSMANFTGDSESVSLEFTGISQPQSCFIECIPTLARRKDYYFMLSEQCQSLLRKISRFHQDADWKLQRVVGKIDRRTRLRTLTLYKSPDYESSTNNNLTTSTKRDDKADMSDSDTWSWFFNDSAGKRPASQERSNPVKMTTSTTSDPPVSRKLSDDSEQKLLHSTVGSNHAKMTTSTTSNHAKMTTSTTSNLAKMITCTTSNPAVSIKLGDDSEQKRSHSTVRSQPKKPAIGPSNLPTFSRAFSAESEAKSKDGKTTRPIAKAISFHCAGAEILDTSKVTVNGDSDKKNIINNSDNQDSAKSGDNITQNDQSSAETVNIINNSDTFNNKVELKSGISSTKNTSDISNIKNVGDATVNVVGMGSRKSKLIQAMSTPLESDKAERMMRMMGWQGGALGLRGGITEPIIPDLRISPGAGLGHVKQKAEPQESNRLFRLFLLDSALSFLRSGQTETAIALKTDICKKKRRFVKVALDSFNARVMLGLGIKAERELLCLIMDELARRPDIYLGYTIDDNSKEMKLFLEHGEPKMSKSGKKKKKREQQNAQARNAIATSNAEAKMEVDLNRENREDGGVAQCGSKKAENALAFRLLFLKQIKQFLEFESTETEHRFGCVLNKKHKAYIESVVAHTNNRKAKIKYSTDVENEMFEEIRNTAKDCYLTVKIELQKYILQKRYYQKRFTNSALDLPPPKSKDLSNTAIYVNGRQVDVDPDCEDHVAANVVKRPDVDDSNIKNNDMVQNAVPDNETNNVSNTKNNVSITRDIEHDDTAPLDVDVHAPDKNNDVTRIKEGVSNLKIRDDDDSVTTNDIVTTVNNGITPNYITRNGGVNANDVRSDDALFKVADSNDVGLKYLNAIYSFACNADLGVTVEFSSVDTPNTSKIENGEVEFKNLDNNETIDLVCDEHNSKESSIDISYDFVVIDVARKESDDSKVVGHESEPERDSKVKELVNYSSDEEEIVFKKEDKIDNNSEDENRDSSQAVKESEINNNLYSNVEDVRASVKVNDSENDLNYLSGKRLWTDCENSDIINKKKCKKYDKIVLSISPKVIGEQISIDKVREIHDLVSKEIDNCKDFLPLLKYHGVVKDDIVYTCYSEESSNWLRNLIIKDVELNLTVSEVDLNDKVEHKLQMKMNTFDSLEKVFERLELYNKDLNTSEWVVEKRNENRDFINITIVIDNESYEYISKAGFSLFAGVDTAQFSVVWD